MKDWDAAVACALALPDVEMANHYGVPVPKLNGKALIAPGREADSFVLMASHDDKAMLLETDPDTFWETDHYRGWPAILVRYDSGEEARIAMLIARRWWDVARAAQRRAYGPRP